MSKTRRRLPERRRRHRRDPGRLLSSSDRPCILHGLGVGSEDHRSNNALGRSAGLAAAAGRTCRRSNAAHHQDDPRAAADRVLDVVVELCDRLVVDQGSNRGSFFETVGDLQGTDPFNSLSTNASKTPLWTYMRFAHTQVSPALRNFESTAPSTALSRSASSNTMNGALPPSSRLSFMIS